MPILIDKPAGYTSHDVIAIMRKILSIKKIGHAGTLDPLATGLLIVLVGRDETKLQDQYMNADKQYVAEITVGQTSTTYDAEGELSELVDYAHISEDQIKNTFSTFVGAIQQRPPIYSAIKLKGRKLYQLARQDKITADDVPAREVNIYSIDIEHINLPQIRLRVRCGKGTYIRSLAHDIGQVLGVGAYLSGLRRTRIGEYTVDDAIVITDHSAIATEYHRQYEKTSSSENDRRT